MWLGVFPHACFVASYELTKTADLQRLGKVTFRYLDQEFVVDVRARVPTSRPAAAELNR